MAGMGAMPGGPGAMINDPSAFAGAGTIAKDPKQMLTTFIYDYFRRNGNVEIAQAMLNEQELRVALRGGNTKTGPGRREVNGIDDGKDGEKNEELQRKIDSLPPADITDQGQDHSFLFDWWCQFWDLFYAASPQNRSNQNATAYFHIQQQQQRMRQMPQQGMMNPAMIQPNLYNTQMARMQQNPAQLQKQAVVANQQNRLNPQFMNMQRQQMGQNMQRDGSDMDGQGRPQSPMSGDGAPSPKKQRLDGGAFSGPQMQGGRAASMGQLPNGGQNMMMANGVDPSMVAQFAGMNGQHTPQSLQRYQQNLANSQRNAMDNVKPGMQQGSPMMANGPDGMPLSGEFFGGNPGAQMNRNQGNAQNGGGALADYQMQLMLLEQQNKKRLMMARQEQDVASRDGQVPGPGAQQGNMLGGQNGPFAPRMSPHGSRTGQSPNSNDQMKRGTPKIGQGSPLPDGSMPATRGSPAPGFDPSQGGMGPQFMNQMQKPGEGIMVGPNGQMIRPPSSNPGGFPPNGNGMTPQQMEIMARQNGGRMPNGQWPPGQMPPQMMQQQGQMGQQGQPDNQQRNQMPPPQAPPGGNGGQRGTNPSSPQQNAAPPTPSQTNKPAPKKKDTKDTKKKPANKKNQANTAATPSSEAEQNPQTPTPATPITPVHPNSFSQKGSGPQQQNNQQQPPTSGAQQGQMGMAQQDANNGNNGNQAPFGMINDGGAPDMGFQVGMDFGALESDNVLGDFDFDSFLQMDQDPGFDLTMDQFPSGNGEGVETGAGDV